MTGRLADLFRLAWGLVYWNARKTWFQARRGRSPCPCQSPSDSGRAFETRCEACVDWADAARFRRVCPLLVPTPNGLRCSVDTPRVRPFWGRALAIYGGAALALYLAGACALFGFLRTVGYPISIAHLVWPPSWHRVGQVRGWFFMERAQRAFAAGRTSEGMLYLTNAHEFDPDNYAVAFTLAQRLQLTHPLRADELYRELIRDHPAQRPLTYQVWFRALLARGDFAAVEEIARLRVLEDPDHASVWMRALIFASRQTGEQTTLRQLLASEHAAAIPWRPLLGTELLLRENRARARAELNRPWPGIPPYGLYYQIDERIELGDVIGAVDLLESNRSRLDDTAIAALLLHAYATMGATTSRDRLLTSLLAPALSPPMINLLAAHLIRHPDPTTLERLFTKFQQTDLALTDATLECHLALFCAIGVAGDWSKLQTLGAEMRSQIGGQAAMLGVAENFFRHRGDDAPVARLLPILPMSLEVHYALLERYPGRRPKPARFLP